MIGFQEICLKKKRECLSPAMHRNPRVLGIILRVRVPEVFSGYRSHPLDRGLYQGICS